MNISIGDRVHFYRDNQFPGKRGPFSATVLRVVKHSLGDSADLLVSGIGGSFHEYDIPLKDKEDDNYPHRYCIAKPNNAD